MWDLRQKQWGNLAFDYVVNPQRDPEWTWWILKEGGKRLKDTHRRYQLFLKAVALLYVMIWKHLNIDSQDKSSPQFFCMYLLLTDAHLFSLSPLLLQKQKKQKPQNKQQIPLHIVQSQWSFAYFDACPRQVCVTQKALFSFSLFSFSNQFHKHTKNTKCKSSRTA